MSASARLRELNAATPLEKYEIDLFRVLPEIVAVVEAAEHLQIIADIGITGSARKQLDAALTALEEKLRA